MRHEPLVSILIPCFHAQDTIVRSIVSLRIQSFQDWEAIIVADDSENYQAVLDSQNIRDDRIRFATTGRTGAGPSYARNVALHEARGDFVAALDADDAYCPDRLEKLVVLANNFGAAHSNVLVRSKNGNSLGCLAGDKGRMFELSLEALVHMPVASHPVFRRGLCEWDVNLRYGEIAKLNFHLYDLLGPVPLDTSVSYAYFYTPHSLINQEASVSLIQQHREVELEKSAKNPADFINPDVHAAYIRSIRHKISIREAAEEACRRGGAENFKDYLAITNQLDITAHLMPFSKERAFLYPENPIFECALG